MSSTAKQGGEVEIEDGIDWKTLFDEIGNEYYEPCSGGSLATTAFVFVDDVNDEEEAFERMVEAVERNELDRSAAGYTIPGTEPPDQEEAEQDDEEVLSGQKSEQDAQDSSEVEDSAGADVENKLDDANNHIQSELHEMQEKVESMHRAVNVQMPMMTTAMRNLFGDIPFEEMPEAATELRNQLDEHEEVLREVSDQVDAIDDLTDNKQESTESRVLRLRRYLVEQAEENSEKFGMNYKQIHSFFNGEIGESWANQLLDKAAGETPDADDHPAFYKKTFNGTKKKQVRVNLGKVPEGSIYRLKNSEEREDT